MQAEQGRDIAPDDVRRQLEHMIVSDVFRGSPQLSSFLSYVVEAALQGKTDRIKGYTIGVEVLRRDTSFDPQVDPIVRVEAGRLRRAIERYYGGPGQADDLIIDIPRGSYVPVFQRRTPDHSDPPIAPDDPMPPASARAAVLSRPYWIAAASVLLVLAGAVGWLRLSAEPRGVASAGLQARMPLVASNGMPVLAVMPFDPSGSANDRVVSAAILREKLREALASFDAINIVLDAPAGTKADFRFTGLIEYHDDGTASLRLRLTDARDDTLVWTRTFARLSAAGDREATEDSIVADVANTLLRPYGVVRSYARSKSLAGGPIDPRYQCILFSSDAIRSYAEADHVRARACLEALTAQDPGFSDGFSYLAILYNREYQFPTGAPSTEPLDRSLRAARRAIELKPNSARAHHALAIVLYLRGELASSFVEFEKAIELNRYDSAIRTDYGSRLVFSGEVDRGMHILLAGLPDGGIVRASWQHFGLFVGYYAQGDLVSATQQAELAASDTFTYGLAARVVVAVRNGNIPAAREIADRIVALRAAWRDDPDGELKRMIPDATIRGNLVQDLAVAGIGPPRPASRN